MLEGSFQVGRFDRAGGDQQTAGGLGVVEQRIFERGELALEAEASAEEGAVAVLTAAAKPGLNRRFEALKDLDAVEIELDRGVALLGDLPEVAAEAEAGDIGHRVDGEFGRRSRPRRG